MILHERSGPRFVSDSLYPQLYSGTTKISSTEKNCSPASVSFWSFSPSTTNQSPNTDRPLSTLSLQWNATFCNTELYIYYFPPKQTDLPLCCLPTRTDLLMRCCCNGMSHAVTQNCIYYLFSKQTDLPRRCLPTRINLPTRCCCNGMSYSVTQNCIYYRSSKADRPSNALSSNTHRHSNTLSPQRNVKFCSPDPYTNLSSSMLSLQ